MTSAVPRTMAEDAEFERRFARVESLLAELAHSSDPLLERATREILATVLELHRRGLERVLELGGRESSTREALAADPRVSAMLLLHGLHPIPLAERVSRALSALRESQRGQIEQIDFGLSEGAEVRVRAVPKTGACGTTRTALKRDLENALIAAAPDAAGLFVEIAEPPPALVTLRVRSNMGEKALGGAGRC